MQHFICALHEEKLTEGFSPAAGESEKHTQRVGVRERESERKGSVYFFGGGAAAALDTPTEKLLKVYLEIKIFEPARLTRRLAALATQAAIIEIAFWTIQCTLRQSKICSQTI